MRFGLYLITDGWQPDTSARVGAALAALPPGAAAVQLRAKSLDGRALLDAARQLRDVCGATPLLINDRVDVALAVGAAGVHLPSAGLPANAVRRIAPGLLIGTSTHSLPEAERAMAGHADFITFGPIFATRSKPGAQPVGVAALAGVAALGLPVFALGGVAPSNAAQCRAVGANVATLGGVLGAPDPGAAAAALWAEVARG